MPTKSNPEGRRRRVTLSKPTPRRLPVGAATFEDVHARAVDRLQKHHPALARSLTVEATQRISYEIGRMRPRDAVRMSITALRKYVGSPRPEADPGEPFDDGWFGESELREQERSLHRAAVALAMEDLDWSPSELNAHDLLSLARNQSLSTLDGFACDAPDRYVTPGALEKLPTRLRAGDEIAVNTRALGYQSSRIGAVLRLLPGAVTLTDPLRVALRQEEGDPPSGKTELGGRHESLASGRHRNASTAVDVAAPVRRDWSPADLRRPEGRAPARELNIEAIERGVRGHIETEAALVNALRHLGVRPLSPSAADPPFDVAWRHREQLYVAEVKSITQANEEHQLRLGLGQLLRYRFALSPLGGSMVRALLVPEAPLTDEAWFDVCASVGVTLLPKPAIASELGERILQIAETALSYKAA